MITKLQNVYYVAADVAKARHFYETVLGLETKFADGERWVQFKAGGGNFAIATPDEAPPGATGGIVVFEVDNLDELRARLVADRLDILAERDMGAHGRTFAVKDPNGSYIQFFERRS